jgi:hypothetical protein
MNGNGNGNGDMDLGGGFGAQAGGAVGTGGVLGGEVPSGAPEIQGPDGLFDINLSAYSPPPDVVFEPSKPSGLPDLEKAFSPPGQLIDITTQIPGYEQAVAGQKRGYTFATEKEGKAVAGLIDLVVGTLVGIFTSGTTAIATAFGLAAGRTVGISPGTLAIGALAKDKYGNLVVGSTPLGPSVPAQAQTQAQAAPSPSVKGIPITMSPEGYKGKTSEGNLESVLSIPSSQKAPSSYPSYYGGTAYPALSMSLFQAKESGGLMIFPSSAAGAEGEMSSLMKKQEPAIDSKSILFLFGMTALGMVLRKGAST